MLEYLVFCKYRLLSCYSAWKCLEATVLSQIRKELTFTVNKICAEYFNRLLEKKGKRKRPQDGKSLKEREEGMGKERCRGITYEDVDWKD
jgi:hypothetical protein